MTTIRSYTDIEQSKKLAEILPLESADMRYKEYTSSLDYSNKHCDIPSIGNPYSKDIPCWSLAALLSILPNEIITDDRFECHYQIDIRKYDGGDNTTLYQIAYGNDRGSSGSWHDMINTGEKESLIDCCAQMIICLCELNSL